LLASKKSTFALKLYRGSFATVRKGKHRTTGERVAIKIISK
jgi:serine/threonine protein kinase